MLIERKNFKSYFGLFTFNFVEDPDRVWTGKTDEIRIEFSSPKFGENWMGVMFLQGRDEIHPDDITLAEICPLTQERIDQFGEGTILNVNYGTYRIGTFKILYVGKASPPSPKT